MFEEPYASRVLELFPAATDNEADEKWRTTDGNKIQEFGTEVKEAETPYLELYGIMDEMYGFK